ncbi:MAG: Chemotaxis protein CheA [Firmicutes bacterium]|nr:Chemotaxis protein CheA [Bacillota bacterium]
MKKNEYLHLFLDETEENVDRLAVSLVALEKQPNDKSLINDVFRDAHTIKGSAGAMGFTQMATVAHHMESVLSLLRENKLNPTSQLFSVLLSALDLLKAIKQDVYGTGREGQHDLSVVINALDAHAQGKMAPVVLVPGQAAQMPEGVALPGKQYKVDVTLRSDTQMKGVRAFILLQNLREFGTVTECSPSEEVLLSEGFDQRFSVLLATDGHSDEILTRIMNDADVEDANISPLALITLAEADVPSAEKAVVRGETRQHSVRVDVKKLELLMNLVGELVIERNRLANVTSHLERQNKDDENVRSMLAVSSQLGRITSDLQREIMKVRMVPIAQLFSTFPRLVRDLAQNLAKDIELILEGADTELDRTIVEEIRDPLIHLVRNSVDHGIELPRERSDKGKALQGRIVLRASHEDNHVVIAVSDDGGGIDVERVTRKALSLGLLTQSDVATMSEGERQRLIMLPGLSTAGAVSDVSGRGVGMDIVRSHIEKVGGSIDIKSILGQGTEFVIRLPLTLAIFRALLVRANGHDYAVAIAAVTETRKLNPADLRFVQGQECLVLREQVVPVVPLYSLLGMTPPEKRPQNLVIASSGSTKVGLLVDRLLGEQEVVIKPLGPFFVKNRELAGATILGDGRVVPILDVNGLLALLHKR